MQAADLASFSDVLLQRLENISLPLGLILNDPVVYPAAARFDQALEKRRANICEQVLAAALTAALSSSSAALRVVLVLSGDGHSRPARDLAGKDIHVTAHKADRLVSFTLTDGRNDAVTSSSAAYVMWIDDQSCRDEPPPHGRWSRKLFHRWPIVADILFQSRIERGNRRLRRRIAALPQPVETPGISPATLAPRDPQKKSVILFCLHWLDFGGAENFALALVKAAHERGHRIIVFGDQLGRHRIIEAFSPYCEAIFLTGNFSAETSPYESFLRICRHYRPDIIHIHHSWTGYQMLQAATLLDLAPRTIDTTHIMEHRDGGFVFPAIRYSEYIDLHHVISEDLQNIFTGTGHVAPAKVAVGKLQDMSRHFTAAPDKWLHISPLRIAFIGRLQPQKRPYLFLRIVRRLATKFGADRFHFTLQGDGSLEVHTRKFARKWGVEDKIEFLPANAPVSEVLKQAHIVILTSQNEGLALLSYEALRADCILISTDVGAQREAVIPRLLVPRPPIACIRRSVDLVSRIISGTLVPADLLAEQRLMLDHALKQPSGMDVCLDFYAAGAGDAT